MNGFLQSFGPILKKLHKFKIEIFILTAAFFIAMISLILYLYDSGSNSEPADTMQGKVLSEVTSRIVVDIAGAVENPGVYEVTSGARLKDILIQAGGLSANAERDYISRNYNLAKLITDQEKIYIPSYAELSNGIFAEPQRFLDYTSSVEQININTATVEELDTLAGIGKVTAQKIVQNRPYKSIEELVSKKIVKKNVYENIKNLIQN